MLSVETTVEEGTREPYTVSVRRPDGTGFSIRRRTQELLIQGILHHCQVTGIPVSEVLA